jgi:hypothetical protein
MASQLQRSPAWPMMAITVAVGTVRAGDRTIKVRRLRITDAGQKAIGGGLCRTCEASGRAGLPPFYCR